MTATLSNRADISTFSFIGETFPALRRRSAKVALRKHLLGLDDFLLSDIGITRLEVLEGRF